VVELETSKYGANIGDFAYLPFHPNIANINNSVYIKSGTLIPKKYLP
jgi:hypothetical protein